MKDDTDLAAWARISSALASDSAGRTGVMSGAIRAVSGRRLIGPAHTIRVVAGDNRSIHNALPNVQAGSVLVVDASGYTDRAVWGGVLTEAAMARGVAGLVLDGATRDIEEIRELGFPVFARGMSPAGPHKAGGGAARGTISCGGVAVSQGDLVIADLDGVTVIPARKVETTLTAALARLELEERWIERIRAGESSGAVLGLDPETLED